MCALEVPCLFLEGVVLSEGMGARRLVVVRGMEYPGVGFCYPRSGRNRLGPMVRNGVALVLLVLVAACNVRGQGGFALLQYPGVADPSDGDYKRWRPLIQSSPPVGWSEGDPFTLTYAIDANIFPAFTPQQRADAVLAIEAALQTWSDSTNGHMIFALSQWQAVAGQDTVNIPLNQCFPATPANQWEGPGFFTDWVAGVTPPPGYGANIEFFTMPEGCEIWLPNNNGPFVMSPGILGFAAYATEGDHIVTVDLFLNESKIWTTDSAAAMASMAMRGADGGVGISYGCSHSCGVECDEHVDGGVLDRRSSRVVFDVETVVLHELGHGLGLGHPNEAAAFLGSVFDPFDFSILCDSCWNVEAVMHGSYSGLKRTLLDEELGAMASMYLPSMLGDLDASGDVSILDAAAALDTVSGEYPVNAWDVNLLDFLDRNGEVDLKEASQVMLWALRPDEYPPGVLFGKARGTCFGSATSVEVRAVVLPSNVGLCGLISVEIRIDNPDQVPFSGWDLDITYDTAVFSNPQLIDGDYLPDGVFTSLGLDDGMLMFSKISFNDDDALSGVLGTVVFDVDIAAAVAVYGSFDTYSDVFGVVNPILVATCPSVHNYGDDAMETLTVVNGSGIAWDYDVNLDSIVDLEDWYAFGQGMIDVNQDQVIDGLDWKAMEYGLRMGEHEDVLSVPR